MTEELRSLLPALSHGNRAQCFARILNLVAKSLLRQFDIVKKPETDDDLIDEERESLDLVEGLDAEELTSVTAALEAGAEDGDVEDDEELEDWVDEVAELTLEERKNLQENICPVKTVLVKVRCKHIKLT